MVLVEGLGANSQLRFLPLGHPRPPGVRRTLANDVGSAVAGGLDLDAVGAATAGLGTLGPTRLAVISTPFVQQAPPSVHRAATLLDLTMQDELAAPLTDHVYVSPGTGTWSWSILSLIHI